MGLKGFSNDIYIIIELTPKAREYFIYSAEVVNLAPISNNLGAKVNE